MYYKITLGDELDSKEIPVTLGYIDYNYITSSYQLYKTNFSIPEDCDKGMIRDILAAVANDVSSLTPVKLDLYTKQYINTIKIKPVTTEESIEEVLEFIEETINLYEQSDFYERYEISPFHYYTCGGCGEFFSILKAQFPHALSFSTYEFGHILTIIDGNVYDVEGLKACINKEDLSDYLKAYYLSKIERDKGIRVCNHDRWFDRDLYYIPDHSPQQKMLENYAFSVTRKGWESFEYDSCGPVNVKFLQTIESFPIQKREEAFFFFRQKHNYKWFENSFHEYIEDIKNNYIKKYQKEAEGVYIPV